MPKIEFYGPYFETDEDIILKFRQHINYGMVHLYVELHDKIFLQFARQKIMHFKTCLLGNFLFHLRSRTH